MVIGYSDEGNLIDSVRMYSGSHPDEVTQMDGQNNPLGVNLRKLGA